MVTGWAEAHGIHGRENVEHVAALLRLELRLRCLSVSSPPAIPGAGSLLVGRTGGNGARRATPEPRLR